MSEAYLSGASDRPYHTTVQMPWRLVSTGYRYYIVLKREIIPVNKRIPIFRNLLY